MSIDKNRKAVFQPRNPLDPRSEDAISGLKERRSFFLIIIFLGCFSLMSLYGAVYLNASIQNLFQSAINEGLSWEGTRQKLTQLSVLSGRVNAPMNDVFISKDISTERDYMRKEYLAFLEVFDHLTRQLEAKNLKTGEQILIYLDDVNANLFLMMSEAEFVFTYLQAGQDAIAGERMALADQMFREANALLGRADEVVQRVSLERFNEDATSVQQLYGLGKIIITLLTVCFVIFVTVGIRMVKTLNRNQKKLAYSRLILSKTLNSVADAVVGCDASGRITEWNVQAEKLFGAGLCDRSTIIDLVPGLSALFTNNLLDLGHLEEVQIDKLKALGEIDLNGDQLQDAPEPTVEVDISIATIKKTEQRGQRSISYVLTIRDMRELRRSTSIVARSQAKLRLQVYQNDLIQAELAEQAQILHEAKIKAEASTEAKSRFLAIMSHELRTPMNAILGFSRILQRGELKKSQEEALKRIVDASDHLLGIINDILDMSKIESGGLMLECRPVHFLDELQSIVKTFGSSGLKNNLRFFSYIDPQTPLQLEIDSTRLRQVITNLLGNAFQFTEKGAVWFRVFPVPSPVPAPLTAPLTAPLSASQVKTNADPGWQWLRFEVHDSGIGMTKEQQEKVFDPFTQADSSITRKYGGTGLGLTITQQIIQSFGGKVELQSEVGQGSCFAFSIPFKKVKKALEPEVYLLNPSISVAVLSRDDLFLDWINYSFSFAKIQYVKFPVLGESLITWWKAQIDVGLTPRIIVDGFCKEYDPAKELENLAIERELLLSCLYFVNIGAASASQAEQVYGSMHYMPVFPNNLVEALNSVKVTTVSQKSNVKSYDVPKLHGRQIMVVDDILSNRQYLHELLKPTGCNVTLVDSGAQAIQMCEIRLFDLILMDIHMPDMNGYDTTKAIKAIRYAKKTHIVGLTADAVDDALTHCIQSGMSTCLGKPFSAHELYATTTFLLNKSSLNVKSISNNGLESLVFDDVEVDIQGALDRINQKTELYQRLISAFLNRTQDLKQRLGELVGANASAEVDQYLASMRGTALSVGAVGLGESIAEFEQAMHTGVAMPLVHERCLSVLQKTVVALQEVESKIS